MKPVRLFRDFFNLYAYSFWKVCHPVRLFKTIRLLEISEYARLLIFDFEKIIEPEVILIQKSDKMRPACLLKNFSDLYAYFFKFCNPVRLLKRLRLLETLE